MAIRERRGGYEVMVYAGIDPATGRQRYVSRQVNGGKRAAEREEARLKTEVAEGRHRGTGAKTLGELLDVWFEWRTSNGKPLSPATRNDYLSLITTKIKPALGKLRLPKVDALTLDRFYRDLKASGRTVRVRDGEGWRTEQAPLSASRVHQVHAVLSGALGLAARYGWLPFNPAALATPPAGKGQRRAVASPEQVRAILRETKARDPELYLFLRVAATTGLRPGEIVALRWCDLDLTAPAIKVTGNVVHTSGLPPAPGRRGGYLRKDTKSEHGERLLALDARTAALLRAYRKWREERARSWGAEKLAEDAYLFATDDSGRHPVRRDSMGKRFRALADDLGHDYTLYGLRHFMASQLGAVAGSGTVRDRMGHGSLAVTSGYMHQVAEADRAAARYMSDLLTGRAGRG